MPEPIEQQPTISTASIKRFWAAHDEIRRLRRIVGLLADYVETEAHDAGSPDPEELLIACGLATWETYDRSIHGDDLGCYVEPGERVWITTDECKRLIEEANNAR